MCEDLDEGVRREAGWIDIQKEETPDQIGPGLVCVRCICESEARRARANRAMTRSMSNQKQKPNLAVRQNVT